jgi:uncharacterized damage-inducible protein DinB
MSTKAIHEDTIATKLLARWDQVAKKLVALAREIPEGKFDSRPAQGMRTADEVLRHIAFWNQYVADSARGNKANDTANELPKDKFSTKAQIIEAVRKSAAEVSEAFKKLDSDLSPDSAEMLVTFLEHNCEHYGQLVVYARLNGIVPPASRG